MKKLVKRFSLYAVGATLGLGFLLMPDLAFAEAGGTNDALKNFSEIAATVVHVISAAAMLMMQFFPPLWGSELITGAQVTEMLRPMWIYVRNLCNIAFVGMILFLALSNMVTSGKGIKEWNIKSKLGPIILGLVAINFSMLAVRVLVDVVNVGTVALLSIADPVIDARGIDNVADYYSRSIDTETFEPCEEGSGGNCKTVRELVNNTFCPSGLAGEACLFKIRKISAIQAEAATMNNPERKNIMLGFGTFFMKLESLPLLSADTRGILDVLDSALFSLVFGVAYLLALLAIMVVLLMRVVMMWLFTIFSPILVMSWVMGIKVPLLSDQFWVYLLVPVKAAGALAFGFVMISQLELMMIPAEFFVSVIEPGASLQALWGPDEFGGWRMLWKILTVVLFWKVVFDFALKDIKGMDGIVNGIKGFGEGAGKLALSTAGEIPIPGLGTSTQNTSINDMFNMVRPSTLNRMATNMRNTRGGGIEGISSAVSDTLGQGNADAASVANAINRLGGNDNKQGHQRLLGKFTERQIKNYMNGGSQQREEMLRIVRSATGVTLADNAGTQAIIDAVNNTNEVNFRGGSNPPGADSVKVNAAEVQQAVTAGIQEGLDPTAISDLNRKNFESQINAQLSNLNASQKSALSGDSTQLGALADSLARMNSSATRAEILAFLQTNLGN